MRINKLYTEYQEHPIGMDEVHPRFSWELQAEENDCCQSAYRLEVVLEKSGRIVWDTGRVNSSRQFGIVYEGEELLPCNGYGIRLWVWNQEGQEEEAVSRFETGLMDTRMDAWEGAQWIAAPYYTVSARTRGVFRIDVDFRMSEGATNAGIVFGENDERLLDRVLNEYGLAGENYIRYEVNVQDRLKPTLDIYRVGYARGDTCNRPFARIPLKEIESGNVLLTEENRNDFHTLSVLVTGNQAQVYFDGYLVDAPKNEKGIPAGRVLNPRGENDVLTYPRLNRIGLFAAGNGEVYFRRYRVSNIRTPSAVFIDEKTEGSLYGRASVFSGRLPVVDDCFVLRQGQITADPSNTSIPMLRRTFRVKKGMCRARLYMTARGIYYCSVNGRDLNNSLLAPGLTQYDKRLNYQTYDVTDLLQEGENGIGVILSSGWWSDAQTFTVSNYNYFGDKEALLCKLVMDYENGECDVIVSDTEHWQYYGEGPYVYAGLFMGEQYDARKEWIAKKFSCPDFDGANWEKPVTYRPVLIEARDAGFARMWPEVNAGETKLIGEYDAPVIIVEERTAENVIPQGSGIYIYDFGQEMAGVPEITFHEEAGTRICIRYGEMLYPDLPRYKGNVGRLMRENYRDAESVDIYVCRGDTQGETYRPRFTFHGFRYVEMIGVSKAPALSEVKALQYSSITEFDGSFTSSDPLLNRFAENVKWSQKCNFINIPTDCPQRNERMGWAGDTHVFCRTALHNANLKLFYERNLAAMSDLQEENGRYPEIAPIGGGFGGITYECASIFMAWELYQQYGDERTLERFYPGMKKYMDYMKKSGLPGKGDADVIGPLADWLAFQDTDPQLMWNAFYYREVSLMEKIAHVLGRDTDEREFGLIRRAVYTYWNQTFVEPSTGRTLGMDGMVCDSQSSYAIAIEYGVVEDVERAAAHLARTVRENGYRVGTGFFGTGLVNRALSRNGYAEEAYRLMLQTGFPSWLYPVTQGATTIWEHWDSFTKENGFGEYNSMNSFNHYSLGSVLSWLYEDVLGIRRLEEYPGYTHFELCPCIGMMDHARGSVASPFGKIEAGWRKEGEKIYYSCTIPANTSATLILSDGSGLELGSGRHEVQWKTGRDGLHANYAK